MSTRHPDGTVNQKRVIAALAELIDALDRRVPHVEGAGEIGIAKDAASLRRVAVTRIEQLERAASDRRREDLQRADSVMTDDGSPTDTGTTHG